MRKAPKCHPRLAVPTSLLSASDFPGQAQSSAAELVVIENRAQIEIKAPESVLIKSPDFC
jgi:hypothetical protein